MMDQDELQKYVARSKDGDHAAFESIVRSHQSYAFALAIRLLADEDQAQEAVQESFVKVWTGLTRYDANRKFSTWLYAIVTNNCLDRLREQKRRKRWVRFGSNEEETESVPADVDLESSLSNRDLCRIVRSLTNGLTPVQRVVFTLRDLQDLTMDEVEEITGMSRDSIKVNLCYARRRMRTMLERRYGVKEGGL